MAYNNLLKNLNDSQLEAILYTDGPSIIIAGAGVGKTKVLTHKISYLISILKIPAEQVLALTFTNKAAKEMKTRVTQLIDDNEKNINIYTYHSLCARILRKEAHNLDISNNFNIIDSDDQKKILKDIYTQEYNNKVEISELRIITSFISQWKHFELNKEDIINDYYDQHEWILRAKVYEKYLEYQKKNSCLDFDDLLLTVKKIFDNFPKVLEKWQNYFKFVLVDEFQDTNNLQYQILLYLVAKHNNLTVVGDPDQTIYSWRGANINLILKFTEKFPNAKTFILTQNYRSTSKILDTANSLIKNNQQRIEKNLFTINNLGENIKVYHAANAFQEANWVAKQIKQIINKEKIKLSQIAVLYRNNYLSKDLEQTFINHNLSYRIIGGFKFFQRKEIKDLLAYLKIIAWSDNLSTIRILNTIPKIGIKTIESLLNEANNLNITIFEYLTSNYDFSKTNTIKNYLEPPITLIKKLQDSSKNIDKLENLLNELLNNTHFITNLENNFENERIENVKQFIGLVAEFDNKNDTNLSGYELLTTFLQEISLYTDIDEENQQEAVSFMTIHSAKGLEFEAVFVIGLNEGVLPGANKNPLSIKDQEKIEEERRLFYVAITRAKTFLFLTSAQGYSHVLNKNHYPSSFFNDLNKQYLDIFYSQNNSLEFPKNNNLMSPKSIKKNDSAITNKWKNNDIIIHEIFGKGIIIKIIGDKIQVAFNKNSGGIKIISATHPGIKKTN